LQSICIREALIFGQQIALEADDAPLVMDVMRVRVIVRVRVILVV
jgi:hypothetical protein